MKKGDASLHIWLKGIYCSLQLYGFRYLCSLRFGSLAKKKKTARNNAKLDLYIMV